jgi:hypothetical protein
VTKLILTPVGLVLAAGWLAWPAAPGTALQPPALPVTSLDRVNTPADEDDPFLAADGLQLFFTSNAGGSFELMAASRRTKGAPFANAKPLDELNGKTDDVSPFLLPREPDGSEYVFFATQSDAKNFDIFFTRRTKPDGPFQRIAKAAVHQVCTDEDELHPWLTSDAKELYFSRKTKDGWRVGWAHGSARRSFDKVDILDLPVGYCHPTVSKDGLTMYLQGLLENGRWGLFVSRRSGKGGAWKRPEPLEPLNQGGPKGDKSPSLSADGTTLYFASDRPGGKGGLDLYSVSTAELRKVLK